MPDEKKESAVAFLNATLACYRSLDVANYLVHSYRNDWRDIGYQAMKRASIELDDMPLEIGTTNSTSPIARCKLRQSPRPHDDACRTSAVSSIHGTFAVTQW
jgi:hypothetical protein